MGQESDDIVSLPAPPPPNPAARRSAIDTAMRKFDGIEDAAPKRASARPGLLGWASSHRRATGGLVTAALIAVVGIPATQIALRNQPKDVATERAAPALPTAELQPVQDNATAAAASPPAEPQAPVPIARNEPVEAPAEPALAKEERSLGFAAPIPEQKARADTAAPLLSSPAPAVAAAPPPPPPPPPAPMAEREAADAVAAESGNIIVTGSIVSRQNMKSAAPAAPARAKDAEDAYGAFEQKLRAAFQSDNRKAVLALIGYPLRVDFSGDVRTYRNRSEVERDYSRIFTSEVRESVLNGQASRHLAFAANPPGSAMKIRSVSP